MSDKKRKRTDDDGARPSKKLSSEALALANTVKFSVVKDVGDWAPVIATAPGLDLPTNVPLKAYKKARITSTPRVSAARRTAISETELILHCGAHPKLDYTAREEVSGGAESLLQHYVGIFDPKTGELQVVPARKLVVRGTLRSVTLQSGEDHTSDEEKTPQSRLQARTILGSAFGTKKSQKAIRALTENAIASPSKSSSNNNILASAVLESMSHTTSSMPTRQELQTSIDEAKPRPKANLDAKTPGEVYTIEDLVGIEALRTLGVKGWQDAVEKGEDVQTSSKFVARRLVKVVGEKDVRRLKALRFVLVMLDWFGCFKEAGKGMKKLPKREQIRAAVGEGIPDSVIEGLRKRFAPDFNMNKWAVDNFITHICALALVIEHCEIDVADLRDDLRLDSRQISQYFLELGCKVANPTETERTKLKISKAESSTHRIAKLKLPLEFPKTRTPGLKKRR